MKVLHTADLHLREYKDKRWETLETLVQIGRKNKVEIFVISGDLFDKGIDAESLRPMIREVFSDNGFKIVLIPGNHDSECYKGGMYFGEDVTVLTNLNEPFEYKNLRIWGLPFKSVDGERLLEELRVLADNLTPDKTNILLYHGELLDTFFSRKDFGEEGDVRYMPVKLSYFKDLNVNYVLAGHFHSKFDTWKLENGGYFVYPGSPISITKRETGQRKVNIFEVGKPPKEYLLDTPHFEEITVEFEPFTENHPLEVVKTFLDRIHPEASIILTIKGYINSARIKMSESELAKQIREITKRKSTRLYLEFRDVSTILEDDLLKNYMKKLELANYDEKKKKELLNLAIEAIMKAKS